MCLNVALNYGGRAELVDAFNAIFEQFFADNGARHNGLDTFRVDEQMIAVQFVHGGLPDPDLLISHQRRNAR